MKVLFPAHFPSIRHSGKYSAHSVLVLVKNKLMPA